MNGLQSLGRFDSQFAMVILLSSMFLPVIFCWSLNHVGAALEKFEERKNAYGSNGRDVASKIGGINGALSRRFLRVATFASRDASNKEPRTTKPSSSVAPSQSPSSKFLWSSPSPSPKSKSPGPSIFQRPHSPVTPPIPPTVSESPPSLSGSTSGSNHNEVLIISGAVGGFLIIVISVTVIILCRSSNVAAVRPWVSGLSGQLQKAFVTGVSKLKRLELEIACEDFSNVVGTSSLGTVFKGTLSSGVEIAVISVAVTSSKDWTKHYEAQFRKKITTLSKVNHKNFVNLLGYCEEEQPFTRMMVFEYAPNGTLFEHLHIREAEPLDWAMRLRIAMGVVYCLDHMHQLRPPIVPNTVNSSVINLTEDYAAKLSDFSFCNGSAMPEIGSPTFDHLNLPLKSPEDNVLSFGLLLFEMFTGKVIQSPHDWAVQDYLRGSRPLTELLDPTLDSFDEEQLEGIGGVIKLCLEPRQRPVMQEVCKVLREVTGIWPGGAVPRLSPLWWAELEVASMEAV